MYPLFSLSSPCLGRLPGYGTVGLWTPPEVGGLSEPRVFLPQHGFAALDLPGRGAIEIRISRLPVRRGFGCLKEMGAPSGKQGRAVSRKQGIRARQLLARAPPSAAGHSRAGAAGRTLQGGTIPDPALAAPRTPQPWGHILPGLLPWGRQGPGWPRHRLLLNQPNRECFNEPFSSCGQAPSVSCQGLEGAGGRVQATPGFSRWSRGALWAILAGRGGSWSLRFPFLFPVGKGGGPRGWGQACERQSLVANKTPNSVSRNRFPNLELFFSGIWTFTLFLCVPFVVFSERQAWWSLV